MRLCLVLHGLAGSTGSAPRGDRALFLAAPALALALVLAAPALAAEEDLEPLVHGVPGLTVDLGVGLWAWPLPVDHDGDGDLDLLVACPDKPSNGVWFFENPDGSAFPVFRPGRRLGPGWQNTRLSSRGGEPQLLVPGHEIIGWRAGDGEWSRKRIYPRDNVHASGGRVRANQWSWVDFDGDGDSDLVVGVGDWSDYGWDDGYDESGRWKRGPLHGFVYTIVNQGSDATPSWGEPTKLEAGGVALDVFGWPSPSFADFDGDGDLDLVCGEFLDRLHYFENAGTRSEPRYLAARTLWHDTGEIRLALQMIVPIAIDWDRDGDPDLLVGEEDGRVAFVENTGRVRGGVPVFARPRHFRQAAEQLKFGALSTPWAADWDGDGDEDILCGNTAGEIGLFENLGRAEAGSPVRWSAPRRLEAGGEPIRIQAGPNGSIQGPCEAKWGYTTLSVADWDQDGTLDLLVNSIWGEVLWYRGVGEKGAPRLEPGRAIEVEWPGEPPRPEWTWWRPRGKQLVTQWRTTPVAVDVDRDGLVDLAMLDTEGYLALFRRERREDRLVLLPPVRVFVTPDGEALRLNPGRAGKSGRRKIALVDWDQDGVLDLLVNGKNADWYRGGRLEDGRLGLTFEGPIAARELSSHTTSPATLDLDGNGRLDLLLGAEDGRLYHLPR